MLCCLYKINLFFFTLTIFSNECFFFFLLYPLQKKKSVTAEIPYDQQKVPLKNSIKWHGQNSQIKHQIIKSDIYNHYSQYFKATEKSRFLDRADETSPLF